MSKPGSDHERRLAPLSSIKVLDLATGLAGAVAVRLLADAGAEVLRLEPEGGDPFYEVYPAYEVWQRGKTIGQASDSAIAKAVAEADICVTGGEAHPDLAERMDPADLRRWNDQLVVLDITGAPPTFTADAFPAVEILAQARSGMVFEQHADHPFAYPLPIAAYGAALHGVIAALAALWRRPSAGRGELVTASMLQGALRWAGSIWAPTENPPKSYNTLTPKGAVPFRLKCSDGDYVQLAPNVPGGLERLYAFLGVNAAPTQPGAKGGNDGPADPRTFFGDVDLLAPYALKFTREELLAGVREAEIPGGPVWAAGEAWDDEQTRHNGLIVTAPNGWETVGLPVAIAPADPASSAAPAPVAGQPGGPLSSVRVVDLGCFVAGPHASVLLADLGADVIKIERLTGDPMRSGYHHYVAANRGKRSIAIDAKTPEGVQVIQRVCESADVVHHNFRPGVSARMGVDRESLKQSNPDVIVLESSAYGASGPKAAQPGFDSVFQAVCGHPLGAGGAGNEPLSYRFAPIDYSTGVVSALGMVLGLHLRRRWNCGSEVQASLLNSGLFLLSELVRSPEGEFLGAPSNGANQLGLIATEALYRTTDGWIAIAVRGQAMASRLGDALGIPAPPLSASWDQAAYDQIASAVGSRSTAQALADLAKAQVWAVACPADLDEALGDPRLVAIGAALVRTDESLGEVRQVGAPVTFGDGWKPHPGLAAVDRLGGHTRQILQESGYSDPEIDDLIARKIVA